MADSREVRIKVSLASGAFNAGVEDMARKSTAAAKKAGSAWKESLSAGMKASGDTMRGMFTGVIGHLKTAATLGGALTFAGMVKGSIELSDRIGEIAFNVEKATGKATDWRNLSEEIGTIAEATGRRTGELAEAFDSVFKATGDAGFAKAALEPIGKISVSTGKDVLQLAETASVLRRKFGANAQTLPEMMTRFIEKTDAGGMSMDDLGRKFALMAGEASEAGFGGAQGLSNLLGILQRLDERVGEGATPGLKKMFQVLKEGSGGLKALEKASGIKFEPNTTAFEKLEKLMEGKGRKAIEAKLSGESRAVFDELVKPFDEAFARARASGENIKDATQEGIDGFRGALKDAGKSSLTYGQIMDKASEEVKDPAEQLNIALDKLQKAFMQPKLIEAFGQIAEAAPAFAEGLAKILSFVVRHPMLSGATLLGGRQTASFASGAIGSMFTGMMKGGGGGDAASGMAGVGGAANKASSGLASFGRGAVIAAGQFGMAAAAMVAVMGVLTALKEEAEHDKLERTKTRGETIQRGLKEGRLKREDLTADQLRAVEESAFIEDTGGTDSAGAFDELQKFKRKREKQRTDAAMLGIEGQVFDQTFKGGAPPPPPAPTGEVELKNPDKIGSSVVKGMMSQTLNVRVTNAGDIGGGQGAGGDAASHGPPSLDFSIVSVPGSAPRK